ncbi:hypothetical protein P3T23_001455 [Paraburkholderia sp. GAS448]|uniref:hypothetical protein n=1 Tax=Paraburkholderia sp. GAS448 TaxID=3035136 RepID=UPI003D20B172
MSTFSKLKYAAVVLMFACSHAIADDARSGIYTLRSVPGTQLDFRKVYLALDGIKASGFFDNPFTRPTANDPDADPTCRFFLSGEVTPQGEIRLDTWYPDRQSGKIETGAPIILKKKGEAWVATVSGDLPNCDAPTIDTGDFLTLKSSRPWRNFAFVNKSKTFLYSAPDDAERTKGYLVRFDAVAVLESDHEWLHVDYFRNDADVVRWVKGLDLTER